MIKSAQLGRSFHVSRLFDKGRHGTMSQNRITASDEATRQAVPAQPNHALAHHQFQSSINLTMKRPRNYITHPGHPQRKTQWFTPRKRLTLSSRTNNKMEPDSQMDMAAVMARLPRLHTSNTVYTMDKLLKLLRDEIPPEESDRNMAIMETIMALHARGDFALWPDEERAIGEDMSMDTIEFAQRYSELNHMAKLHSPTEEEIIKVRRLTRASSNAMLTWSLGDRHG